MIYLPTEVCLLPDQIRILWSRTWQHSNSCSRCRHRDRHWPGWSQDDDCNFRNWSNACAKSNRDVKSSIFIISVHYLHVRPPSFSQHQKLCIRTSDILRPRRRLCPPCRRSEDGSPPETGAPQTVPELRPRGRGHCQFLQIHIRGVQSSLRSKVCKIFRRLESRSSWRSREASDIQDRWNISKYKPILSSLNNFSS